ncbi:MAG: SDR family NAD(P)-dependent oxidoreductase [Pseudomonadota bacterium]
MDGFSGQTAWVTGASSGIGRALAIALSEAGARVILSGRRVDALQTVAEQMSTPCKILPFEVTDYDILMDTVSDAWSWAGTVDLLFNNAGVSQRSLAIATDPQVYSDLINIDLIAPIWLTQLQLPQMVAAGGAHIIAICSVAGRIGPPLRTAYAAAKHGLIGYMDALRTEVSIRHNIHITNVLPGSVATDVSRNALTADGSSRGKSDANIDGGDDPENLANEILKAIIRKTPEFIYAKGMELELAELRHRDPVALFETMNRMGAKIAARYEAAEGSNRN